MNQKIDQIVTAFYKKAVSDFILAYQFKKIAATQSESGHPLKTPIEAFSHHLPRISLFWKNQLLGTPLPQDTKPFDLIKIHQPLSIRRGEVGRWLVLFKETLDEQLSEEKEDQELKEKWIQKLARFEKAILNSPLLFPKQD